MTGILAAAACFKPTGISGPPRAIVTIALTLCVTNDCMQFSIVVTLPAPSHSSTVQPSGCKVALSCAIQTARFSDVAVLGSTPIVCAPGLFRPEPADELADVE